MPGRTPGKFIFGTCVVNTDGYAPSLGQAVGRTLCRMIPCEPFSVLFARDSERAYRLARINR
ncbi:RDD family protein [Lysobacter lacus]|uniref:RDD family protein n=1 Tax=Cognatilysobacter lacus TaxID=1643323 RepID=A0A5D8Z539_9GAMM|nr:RDD family protein [Lysobacter lacus]